MDALAKEIEAIVKIASFPAHQFQNEENNEWGIRGGGTV